MHSTQPHHEPVGVTFAHGGAVQDASGYTIFSAGDIGAAHATAHRMLDEGEFELGHALLGSWLEGRSGSGSEWLHLQFHMAVFELELGIWDAAYERYVEHLLPAAATTSLALTDAPAIAWRLALSPESSGVVPWGAVRSAAMRRLEHRDDAYVELHHVLAFAGAGDLDLLDRWIRSRERRIQTDADRLMVRFGRAMRAYATGDVAAAASGLAEVVPCVSEIGGSRAQNELFEHIRRAARRQLDAVTAVVSLAAAA
jgi:hypothetical protein